MRKIAILCLLFLALPLVVVSLPARAQETKIQPTSDLHYYRLDFAVKEFGDDGRVVNSRTYHTAIATDHRSAIVRTGTRIPIHTNVNGEIQYIDVGVNIDCGNAQDSPEGLSLQITAEISSLANPTRTGEASTPIIRQNRWQSDTVLPIGKPITVFSSDNLENKGHMEVEATATPIR